MLKLFVQCSILVVALSVLVPPPVSSAEQSQEIAARALLGEAEKLIELALPQEALPVLDKVRADYPSTEAATYAGLRRAQALMFAHSYDEAIAEATQMVAANPGKVIACWAQCTLGQSLVFKGRTADGVRELWKVPGMLPDQADLGPANEAREVLGRVCEQYLEGHGDDMDGARSIGLNAADVGDKAKLLAILAAYRAREGDIERAGTTLNRLASECPAQSTELNWAGAEVAMYCLDRLERSDEEHSEAASLLSQTLASLPPNHHSGAKACLTLARYHRRRGDSAKCVELLTKATSDYAGTANAAEILYETGNALYACSRGADARGVLEQVVSQAPRSGYVAPALYVMGSHPDGDIGAAMAALTQLAEGQYDRRWRGLALRRLGGLYASSDRTKATDCYSRAIEVFEECLADQRTDVGENWRNMLESRIASIRAEMNALGLAR